MVGLHVYKHPYCTAKRDASGIGLHITRALAENGAKKVFIIGRRRQTLEDAAKEIVRNYGKQCLDSC